MEPKEQRKVDDFIVFAMCAAEQAVDDAGWKPKSDEDQIATGVLIGSGIGGLEASPTSRSPCTRRARAGSRRSSFPGR